jgi:hypothetical protein
MAKRLAVKTLADWLGVVFFPLDDGMAYFDRKYITYFSAVLKGYNKHWKSGYDCVCSFVHFHNLYYLYDAWFLRS